MIVRRALLLLGVVAGCTAKDAPPATPGDSASASDARVAVVLLNAKAQRWMADGMLDSLVTGYYAPEAVVMNRNAPVATGSDAIRAVWTELAKPGLVRPKFQVARVYAADSIATMQGAYTFDIRPRPPADTSNFITSDRGSFVTTFIRRSGAWRVVLDITTSEVPAAAPY